MIKYFLIAAALLVPSFSNAATLYEQNFNTLGIGTAVQNYDFYWSWISPYTGSMVGSTTAINNTIGAVSQAANTSYKIVLGTGITQTATYSFDFRLTANDDYIAFNLYKDNGTTKIFELATQSGFIQTTRGASSYVSTGVATVAGTNYHVDVKVSGDDVLTLTINGTQIWSGTPWNSPIPQIAAIRYYISSGDTVYLDNVKIEDETTTSGGTTEAATTTEEEAFGNYLLNAMDFVVVGLAGFFTYKIAK